MKILFYFTFTIFKSQFSDKYMISNIIMFIYIYMLSIEFLIFKKFWFGLMTIGYYDQFLRDT